MGDLTWKCFPISNMKLQVLVMSVILINGALGCHWTLPFGSLVNPKTRSPVMENMIERLDKALPEMNLLKNRDSFWDDYMKSLEEFWGMTGEINNTVPPPPEVRAFMATLVKRLDRAYLNLPTCKILMHLNADLFG